MNLRILSLALLLTVAGCAQPEAAQEPPTDAVTEPAADMLLASGLWTGGLTPMNHPDQTLPMRFQVSHTAEALNIVIEAPDGTNLNTRGARIDGDTLRFVFIEPEALVPLRCALGGAADSGFEGRCADAAGKWAQVTMMPPEAE